MVDLEKHDRIRPKKKSVKYRIKAKDFTVELILSHQQLWTVDSVDDDVYTLSNTGCTMKLVLEEERLCELFDVLHITRGRFYTDPGKKLYGR